MDVRLHLASLLLEPCRTLGADVTVADLVALLQEPRDRALADVALPTFKLAKAAGLAPPAFCARLAELLQPALADDACYAAVEATGPFLNARLDPVRRQARLLAALEDPSWGRSTEGEGKVIGLDYSSPNIAKPFGIGHLRSTAIGRAIARLWEMRGYRAVGVNHLGDWGTQFGKLMAAFEAFGDEAALEANPIQHLYDIYVEFHRRAETDPAWDDAGRAWFRRLEQGDEAAQTYWTRFRELSLREFERLYRRLDVTFDHFWGEAFYNDQLDQVVADVEASGLAQVSEGALVVPLDDLHMPPCLIRKSDGATLYATRDLAAARWRWSQLHFEKFFYVVGHAQSVHFQQVFAVLERMGYAWAKRLVHVPFGLIQGISTRKGTLVFLEDILDRGRDMARAILADREGLTDPERDEIAEQVTIGAVVFQDLSRDRMRDYEFDWDQMLRGLRPGEPGRTGPYLQYTHVRLGSLLQRWLDTQGALPGAAGIDASLLLEDETRALGAMLERWPEVLHQASEACEPAVLSRWLLDLAEAFNAFYTAHKVISDDAPRSRARVALTRGVHRLLGEGLHILGVPRPTRM
jgi:arginyl-tRNA synthetase